MLTIILAGGRGSRLGTLTSTRPKALVEIAGQPVISHVMRHIAECDSTAKQASFLIAAGYQAAKLQQHFAAPGEWPVEGVDTGRETTSGDRLKQLAPRLTETFLMAWCDGLTDVDLAAMHRFHREQGRLATVLAVHPPSRFGRLQLTGELVGRFEEKSRQDDIWINGGYFLLEPAVLNYLTPRDCSWEHDVLAALAADGQLAAFRHEGFWQCMDTPAERQELENLCHAGQAPWQARSHASTTFPGRELTNAGAGNGA